MNHKLLSLFASWAVCLALTPIQAATVESANLINSVSQADAIAVAEVMNVACYENTSGVIYTKAVIRVMEPLKGQFPQYFEAIQPGGVLDNIGQYNSLYPFLDPAHRALVMIEITTDGPRFLPLEDGVTPLYAEWTSNPETPATVVAEERLDWIRTYLTENPQEGADLTPYAQQYISSESVTSTGLLGDTSPYRYIANDRGETIPVIYDASTRPAGISEAQCLEALEEAIAAWEGASNLDLEIIGSETFAQSAQLIAVNGPADGIIYVQFHDNFNFINSASVLGQGGSVFTGDARPIGGIVSGLNYQRANRGYIIMEHGQVTLQNLTNLKEVLTHELGHTLGLAHSSENVGEPDFTKEDATMYFQVHKDGRGADVRTWDINTILQSYPTDNTPPYAFDRYIIYVNGFGPITHELLNRYKLFYGDEDGDPVTLSILDDVGPPYMTSELVDSDQYLEFTQSTQLNGDQTFNPPNNYNPTRRMVLSVTDGEDTAIFIVTPDQIFLDQVPNGSPDGLPDNWMTTYFGSASASGPGLGPDEDFDGDGFTNMQEFLNETDPTAVNDINKIVDLGGFLYSMGANEFDVVELLTSSDLLDFTAVKHRQILDGGDSVEVQAEFTGPAPEFFELEKH